MHSIITQTVRWRMELWTVKTKQKSRISVLEEKWHSLCKHLNFCDSERELISRIQNYNWWKLLNIWKGQDNYAFLSPIFKTQKAKHWDVLTEVIAVHVCIAVSPIPTHESYNSIFELNVWKFHNDLSENYDSHTYWSATCPAHYMPQMNVSC